jgi:hypothetical protein
MIYREYYRPGWGDPPECGDPNLVTFGFFDAQTSTNEIFCLTPPTSYIEQRQIYWFDTPERSPFDDHTTLINNRFLVDLRAGSWLDLQGTLSTTVDRVETLDWFGHGRTWWDPQTRQPMAHIKRDWEQDHSDLLSEAILFCPMEGDACQPLVSVQDHVHGNLSDILVSPDGQTILWSARVFPDELPVGRPGDGPVIDIVAFATDVQTGATTEIFRLSQHNTTSPFGIYAVWAEDGLTLAIDMQARDVFESGTLLVQFSGGGAPAEATADAGD